MNVRLGMELVRQVNEEMQEYIASVPEEELYRLLIGYHSLLNGDDAALTAAVKSAHPTHLRHMVALASFQLAYGIWKMELKKQAESN